MGINMFRRNCRTAPFDIAAPNPDPSKFYIEETIAVGNCIVAIVVYPNCTNFEGKKILVFRDMSLKWLKSLTTLDPHFSTEATSPFARFEPTDDGWKAAVQIAGMLNEQTA